jgi:hypothetical protein
MTVLTFSAMLLMFQDIMGPGPRPQAGGADQ